MSKREEALEKATAARAAEKRAAVERAIAEMVKRKEAVNVSSVARAAGVSKNYLYKHEDLLSQVVQLRVEREPDMTERDYQAVISVLKKEVNRLKREISEYRQEDGFDETSKGRIERLKETENGLLAENSRLKEENANLRRQLEVAYTLDGVC